MDNSKVFYKEEGGASPKSKAKSKYVCDPILFHLHLTTYIVWLVQMNWMKVACDVI
jgi:hypothetical protein